MKTNIQVRAKVRVQHRPHTLDEEDGQRVVCDLPHVPFTEDRPASPLRYLGQSRMPPVAGTRFDRGGGGGGLLEWSHGLSGHGRRHGRLNESG